MIKIDSRPGIYLGSMKFGQSPTMRHQLQIIFGLLTLAIAQSLRGEIIIDDFDDPAQVISPEMEGEFVVTNNVGLFNATRTFLIFGQSDPVAQLDSNLTTPSRLTGTLTDFEQPNSMGALMRFSFSYRFNGNVDLTENGRNNAFLFDVASFESDEPSNLTVIIAGEIDFHIASIDLASSTLIDPVRLPLESFRPRGGGPLDDDFDNVSAIFFQLFARNAGNDLRMAFQLDRIRVGAIPEPSTFFLLINAFLILINGRVFEQTP